MKQSSPEMFRLKRLNHSCSTSSSRTREGPRSAPFTEDVRSCPGVDVSSNRQKQLVKCRCGKPIAVKSVRCVVMMKLSFLIMAGVLWVGTPMWAQASPSALVKAEEVTQAWAGTLVDF